MIIGFSRKFSSSAPIVSSFSYSADYGGEGSTLPTLESMYAGLFEPFAALYYVTTTTWLQANLSSLQYVTSVTLGPSTDTNGWGAEYLNGFSLQFSDDNGSTWETVTVLSGFVTATSPTVGITQTIPIGQLCTNVRVFGTSPNEYLSISQFRVN